jgi:hypothetical protein
MATTYTFSTTPEFVLELKAAAYQERKTIGQVLREGFEARQKLQAGDASGPVAGTADGVMV